MADVVKDRIKMFTNDERRQLSSEKVSKHASRVIREVLLKYKNGITIKDLIDMTGFNKNTIEKHLVELVAINFAYRKSFGKTYVYYPNGRTMHSVIEKDVEIGDKIYTFYKIADDNTKPYVYIQEKKRDSVNALKPSGGIIIKGSKFKDFIKTLHIISKKMEEVDNVQSQIA